MPTTRRRSIHAGVTVGFSEAKHLLEGDCQLFCGLGDRLGEREWFQPVCVLRIAQAAEVWRSNRDWLLEFWNTRPSYAYDERPAKMPGPYPWGWAGVRSFGEIWFDGVKMGRRRRAAWDPECDLTWRTIHDRIAALKEHLEEHPQ